MNKKKRMKKQIPVQSEFCAEGGAKDTWHFLRSTHACKPASVSKVQIRGKPAIHQIKSLFFDPQSPPYTSSAIDIPNEYS